jgi:hypothetical protein
MLPGEPEDLVTPLRSVILSLTAVVILAYERLAIARGSCTGGIALMMAIQFSIAYLHSSGPCNVATVVGDGARSYAAPAPR